MRSSLKMSSLRTVVCLVLVGGLMTALLVAQGEKALPSGTAMAAAAEAFLASLPEDQRQLASFGFDDPERLNWHFIPRERKGVALRQLKGPAVDTAARLISTGVSATGQAQVLDIMSLEEVLYLVEQGDRTARREKRDPKKYYLSVFGKPGATGKWGWRLEGHHLSLNFALENGELIGSTPEFFGSNPANIEAGPGRSIRVLATEEDLARQLVKLCTGDQRKLAIQSPEAPDDVRGANVPQPDNTPPVGLPFAQMSADQQQLLGQLLEEYLKNMPADVSARRKQRLMDAGLAGVHFGWWGSTERNERHHYRVQGPTFLIEYNNTQSNANHVHSYWRDLAGDFGIGLKKSP